jgi:hypothetical protein
MLLIANIRPLEGALLGFRFAGAQRRHISTKIASKSDQRKSGRKHNSMIKPWQANPKVLEIFARKQVSKVIGLKDRTHDLRPHHRVRLCMYLMGMECVNYNQMCRGWCVLCADTLRYEESGRLKTRKSCDRLLGSGGFQQAISAIEDIQ